MNYFEMAKAAINPTGYLLEMALKAAADAFSSSSTNENTTPEQLSEAAVKASITANILSEQAKVEQELSIAKRILIAEEVEIEEFYDVSGSGGVGVKSNDDTTHLGAHAEGKKVTKRVIKFKGFNSEAISLLTSSVAAEMKEQNETSQQNVGTDS